MNKLLNNIGLTIYYTILHYTNTILYYANTILYYTILYYKQTIPARGSAAADNYKTFLTSITESPQSPSYFKRNLLCKIRRKKDCYFAFILGQTFKS